LQTIDECEAFEFGPYRLIPSKRILLAGKNRVELGSRALDILIMLLRHRGEVVTRRQLLERVWPGLIVDEANLRVQMSELRRALSSGGSAYIKNVHGRGYMFVAHLETVHASGASTASTSPSPIAKLPTALKPTIGRDGAIESLVSQTLARRFVTIVGPGGIGKTTVAIELGRRLASEFNGDVRFVDLSPLKAPDAVLPTIATALGCSVHSDDLLALAAFVARRRLALIVDCCEHVIAAAANVAAVLFQHAPQIHIIATSREALRADGEAVYLLEPLGLPLEKQDLTASEALAAASVGLFMQYAATSGYARKLDNEQARAVAEICRRLDGNPLAIGLAGSRLITHGFKGLLKGLRGPDVLSWSGHRLEARHRTLEATLDWSFRLLSDLEQRVLARLSVLIGSFTMEAAQAQASDAIDDDWMVAQAVEELADNSLIAIVPLDDTYLYRMSDVTRLYAGMKLAQIGDRTATVMSGLVHERQSLLGKQSTVTEARRQRDAHLSQVCC
jgi:predicted ATPase/DNA-binding winged helix-turn-helix (wHTH) protein